jgi:hypothetical protein
VLCRVAPWSGRIVGDRAEDHKEYPGFAQEDYPSNKHNRVSRLVALGIGVRHPTGDHVHGIPRSGNVNSDSRRLTMQSNSDPRFARSGYAG